MTTYQIILATDLAHGFEYVARFKASTTSKGGRRASIVPDMGREGPMSPSSGGSGGVGGTPKGGSGAKDPLQAQILLMQMVIKVRAEPVRPVDWFRSPILLCYVLSFIAVWFQECVSCQGGSVFVLPVLCWPVGIDVKGCRARLCG